MKTPAQWLEYYRCNRTELLTVPWECGAELTPAEKRDVARSIQEFQCGESSEGHHLIADARAWCEQAGDRWYLETMRLFIAEEQRHARELGRFLRLNGLPLVKTTSADRVFRAMRNLWPGLELSISVLVTAEIIAQVYYAALREATGSRILRAICDQILRDELQHVAFQTQQLARLREGRGPLAGILAHVWQRLLFFAAALVIAATHRPVLRRARLNDRAWWQACWRQFALAFPGAPARGKSAATGSSRSALVEAAQL